MTSRMGIRSAWFNAQERTYGIVFDDGIAVCGPWPDGMQDGEVAENVRAVRGDALSRRPDFRLPDDG